MNKRNSNSGFTLVELAIVLVIIGLIVGGVLVGQDLIKAATIRAGVTQLEQYDTATNTFRGKYNGLPGDLANQTNFFPSVVGTGTAYQGDNDGLIASISATGPAVPCATATGTTSSGANDTCVSGEGAVFWYELNQAGLIPQVITNNNATTVAYTTVNDSVLPASKLGKGARIAVQSYNGRNYYVLGNFGSAIAGGIGTYSAAMSPVDALQLDTKMDDSYPASGKVLSVTLVTLLPGTVSQSGNTATDCQTLPSGSATLAYNATTGSTNAVGDSLKCSLSVRTSF